MHLSLWSVIRERSSLYSVPVSQTIKWPLQESQFPLSFHIIYFFRHLKISYDYENIINVNGLTANKTNKTKQGITRNHQSTIVKCIVISKSLNIWKSVTFRKCIQIQTFPTNPLPTSWTQSNLQLDKVLRIAHVEISMQSTSGFHSISERRCFSLGSSSVFGEVWMWVFSITAWPDSLPRIALGFWRYLTVFMSCKDPIALSALNTS